MIRDLKHSAFDLQDTHPPSKASEVSFAGLNRAAMCPRQKCLRRCRVFSNPGVPGSVVAEASCAQFQALALISSVANGAAKAFSAT